MARTTAFGVADAWLTGDSAILLARDDHAVFQPAGGESQRLDIPALVIVPSTTDARALLYHHDPPALHVVSWTDNAVSARTIAVAERYVLPTSFAGDRVYLGCADDVIEVDVSGNQLEVSARQEIVWPVELHLIADDRLWAMGSSLGAAHYAIYRVPGLEVIEEGDVDHRLRLRMADKLALKQLDVGDVVDTHSAATKPIPVEMMAYSRVHPVTSREVAMIDSSVDDDGRILATRRRYVTDEQRSWTYPLEHTVDIYPRAHALGRMFAVATATPDSGRWAVLDIETGEELGTRSRPVCDVPCLRICGNHLVVAWSDGTVEIAGL